MRITFGVFPSVRFKKGAQDQGCFFTISSGIFRVRCVQASDCPVRTGSMFDFSPAVASAQNEALSWLMAAASYRPGLFISIAV